jgi:multidrug resistance efflux pump
VTKPSRNLNFVSMGFEATDLQDREPFMFNARSTVVLGGIALAATLGVSSAQTRADGSPLASGNPAAAVQLNFQTPGVITQLLVGVGDQVRDGQVLAREDTSVVQIAVTTAQANLKSMQAALAALTAGPSAPDETQQQQSIAQGQALIDSARQVLADALAKESQDTTTQHALVAQTRQALSDVQAEATQNTITAQHQADAAQALLAIDQAGLNVDENQLASDEQTDSAALGMEAAKVQDDKTKVSADMTAVAAAEDNQTIAAAQAQLASDQADLAADETQLTSDQHASSADAAADTAKIQDDKTRVAADMTAVAAAEDNQAAVALTNTQQLHQAQAALAGAADTAAASTLADEQEVHSAQATLESQQQQLAATKAANAVKTAPPTAAAITQAQAAVTTAQGQLQNAQLTLNTFTLRAPADGVIAAISGHVGEISAATNQGSGLITLEEPAN